MAKRTAARIERKLTASISAAATVEQKPAAPALAANGGGGGGTRVMIIGELRTMASLCCHAEALQTFIMLWIIFGGVEHMELNITLAICLCSLRLLSRSPAVLADHHMLMPLRMSLTSINCQVVMVTVVGPQHFTCQLAATRSALWTICAGRATWLLCSHHGVLLLSTCVCLICVPDAIGSAYTQHIYSHCIQTACSDTINDQF